MKKILLFIASIIISGLIGKTVSHSVEVSDSAAEAVITTFSIMIGFLMTVVSLVAQPRVDNNLGWRFYERSRDRVAASLFQAQVLITLYLVAIITAIAALLVDSQETKEYLIFHTPISELVDMALVSSSCLALFFSILLPKKFVDANMARYDEIIEQKRQDVGIK